VDNACNKEHSQIPEVQELSTVQVWYCWFLLSCSKGNLDLLTGKPVRFFESNHAHSGGIGHILYGRPMTHGFTVPNPTSVVTDYDENVGLHDMTAKLADVASLCAALEHLSTTFQR
jgi:hypothetical protein